MMHLSPRGFLVGLLIIFFGAIAVDVLRMAIGLNLGLVRFGIYLGSAALLTLLLYDRLDQLQLQRSWAVLGLVPPIGFVFGLYIYVSPPNPRGAHGRRD